jgi:cobyrinic acid a,c-diamide synthase
MALILAGERSGVGKTTVTLALLAALRRRSRQVQSFKVGPDYIDPMFHQFVTQRVCRTLDPVLTSEAYVQTCFAQHSQTADYALVEGVMGLFDGAAGADDWASTAHIARLLELPILLVLDCSRLSRSVAAIAHGYRSFDPRLKFAGVVLNRVGSDRHLDLLKAAIAPLNLPVLGVLRRQDNITIPDRHLGLIPTAELDQLNQVIDRLANLGETCFDWSALLPLLASPASSSSAPPITRSSPSVRLAVAQDRAFSFYYADNLELLETLGAELVFWSPIADSTLPEGVQGLYFGGGFPEVFAEALMANQTARASVRSAIQAGMPTYAECGGLMYLAERIVDFDNRAWEMVGILPTTAQMGNRLTLGYRRATVLQDSPVLPQAAIVCGHEFHRSTLVQPPTQPLYQLQGYDAQGDDAQSCDAQSCDAQRLNTTEGWQFPHLHASYVHLHWGATPEIPTRFLDRCRRYSLPL